MTATRDAEKTQVFEFAQEIGRHWGSAPRDEIALTRPGAVPDPTRDDTRTRTAPTGPVVRPAANRAAAGASASDGLAGPGRPENPCTCGAALGRERPLCPVQTGVVVSQDTQKAGLRATRGAVAGATSSRLEAYMERDSISRQESGESCWTVKFEAPSYSFRAKDTPSVPSPRWSAYRETRCAKCSRTARSRSPTSRAVKWQNHTWTRFANSFVDVEATWCACTKSLSTAASISRTRP